MAEISKQTVTTQGSNTTPVVNTTTKNTSTEGTASSSQTIEYLTYFIFGTLEVLLVFRLILRLTGANSYSAFVGLIYGITGVFIAPFQGIFHQTATKGIETSAVLEPATLIALVVYAILSVGIVKLIRIISGKQQGTN